MSERDNSRNEELEKLAEEYKRWSYSSEAKPRISKESVEKFAPTDLTTQYRNKKPAQSPQSKSTVTKEKQKLEQQLNTHQEQLAEATRVRSLAHQTAERQAANEKLNEKINSLKVATTWARLVTIVLSVILLMSLSWLAEDVFSNQYQVSTYICYTTTYGECYHADYCGSLWNSAHPTTVYKAQNSGYQPCSKCDPYEPTTEMVTEPASAWLIWLVGTGCIVTAYLLTITVIKTQIKKAQSRIKP